MSAGVHTSVAVLVCRVVLSSCIVIPSRYGDDRYNEKDTGHAHVASRVAAVHPVVYIVRIALYPQAGTIYPQRQKLAIAAGSYTCRCVAASKPLLGSCMHVVM